MRALSLSMGLRPRRAQRVARRHGVGQRAPTRAGAGVRGEAPTAEDASPRTPADALREPRTPRAAPARRAVRALSLSMGLRPRRAQRVARRHGVGQRAPTRAGAGVRGEAPTAEDASPRTPADALRGPRTPRAAPARRAVRALSLSMGLRPRRAQRVARRHGVGQRAPTRAGAGVRGEAPTEEDASPRTPAGAMRGPRTPHAASARCAVRALAGADGPRRWDSRFVPHDGLIERGVPGDEGVADHRHDDRRDGEERAEGQGVA